MTRSPDSRYATPAAMRRALTDRLRQHADPRGQWALADLQRQYAYDRLLHRLYRVSGDWVVKGATALLARRIAVRHTVDIDIYRATTVYRMEQDVRTAARLDLGDWMQFDVGASRQIAAAGADNGVRLPVRAVIGTSPWAQFHVDLLGEGLTVTGVPDEAPPLAPIALPGIDTTNYRVYPLVDHVADKTCAILEWHGSRPSARYKDLVDLVALVGHIDVAADTQVRALDSEAERRHLTLPQRFEVPDRFTWERGYAAAARRANGLVARSLDQALALTCPFLDPLLQRSASGHWNPQLGIWHT
jgi:hypothetical protein